MQQFYFSLAFSFSFSLHPALALCYVATLYSISSTTNWTIKIWINKWQCTCSWLVGWHGIFHDWIINSLNICWCRWKIYSTPLLKPTSGYLLAITLIYINTASQNWWLFSDQIFGILPIVHGESNNHRKLFSQHHIAAGSLNRYSYVICHGISIRKSHARTFKFHLSIGYGMNHAQSNDNLQTFSVATSIRDRRHQHFTRNHFWFSHREWVRESERETDRERERVRIHAVWENEIIFVYPFVGAFALKCVRMLDSNHNVGRDSFNHTD